MKQKTDLRVIKTKKAIYDAFIRLMHSKGLNAMTVQDILDEALINRKTFYTYFHDKYDLAEQIAAKYLNNFDAILAKRIPADGSTPLEAFRIEELYSEFYENRMDILAIWKIRTDRINVFDEMSKRLQKIYLQLAEYYDAPGNRQLQSYMFSNFVLTTYQHVLETDQNYETYQLLKEYQNLCDVIEKASKEYPTKT